VTIFLGCGFAAKDREGGGNFSVPLQWCSGATTEAGCDLVGITASDNMHQPMRQDQEFPTAIARATDWLTDTVCFIKKRHPTTHDLDGMRLALDFKRELSLASADRMSAHLAYSIHPPLLLKFERRVLLRSGPAKSLLDDEDGNGAVVPS